MYPLQKQSAKPEPGQVRDPACFLCGAGTSHGLEKCSCRRSTKTLPAAAANLLLVLLNMVMNKKLTLNTEISFSSTAPPTRPLPGKQLTHTLPVPRKASDSLGYCSEWMGLLQDLNLTCLRLSIYCSDCHQVLQGASKGIWPPRAMIRIQVRLSPTLQVPRVILSLRDSM